MANPKDNLPPLDRRDFLRFLSGGALVVVSGGLLTGCGGGGGGNSGGGGTPSSSTPLASGQMLNSGSITLPTGSPLSLNQFVVQTTLDAGTPATASAGSLSGNYRVVSSSQNNHLMMAVKNEADGSQTPYLLAISTGTAGANPTIDENSTAAALIFLNPLIGVSNPAAGQALLAQIATLPQTAALANAIGVALAAGHSPLDGTDPNIASALQDAVTAEIQDLAPGLAASVRQRHTLPIVPTDKRNGITLSPNGDFQVNGNTITIPLIVQNERFRYLSAYDRAVDDTEGNDVSARQSASGDTTVKDFDISGSSAIGLSDTISAIKQIANYGSVTGSPQNITLSGPVKSRYVLSLYGLGTGSDSFSAEGTIPSTLTLIFNIVAPVISVVTSLPAGSLKSVFVDYLENLGGAAEIASMIQDAYGAINDPSQGPFEIGKKLYELFKTIIQSSNFQQALGHFVAKEGVVVLGKVFSNFLLVGRIIDAITNAVDAFRALFDTSTLASQTNFIIQLQGTGTIQITRLIPDQERQLLCDASPAPIRLPLRELTQAASAS